MENLLEKFITYGIPAICLLLGGFISNALSYFRGTKTATDDREDEREKELFRRVHELWEQEIERHELCQDEVRRLNDRLNVLLLQLARNGIVFVENEIIHERILPNQKHSAEDSTG